MLKEYIVNYRLKGDKNGDIFETYVCAKNRKLAEKYAREDLEKIFTIISIKLNR